MNDIFSFSRFWLLLRRDFIENHRFFVIGGFALLLSVTLVFTLLSPALVVEGSNMFVGPVIMWCYAMGSGIAASLMFSDMRTKQGRITLFSLPATSAEKFAEQFFVYVIGFGALFFGCIWVGELLRSVFAPLLYDNPAYATYINHFNLSWVKDLMKDATGWYMMSSICNFFASVCLYVLAAVLWPRYSYIKMYLVNMLFAGVCAVLGVIFIDDILNWINLVFPTAESEAISALAWGAVALNLLVGIVLLSVAYVLFCRKQVVE